MSMQARRISIIAVMAANRVIGKNNKMPWHHKADLRHFKELTMGKPIVMGRRTFESIGRPLPGRDNIVITRKVDYKVDGIAIANSVAEAFTLADKYRQEIMVIGGGELYAELLPQADTLYLTLINHDYAGDTYFPELARSEWNEVARQDFPSDSEHLHPFSFVTLKKAA